MEMIPKFIVDLTMHEVEVTYAFGKRIAILISCWFLLLFSIELILRVIFGLVAFVTRLFTRPSSSEEVPLNYNEGHSKSEAVSAEE